MMVTIRRRSHADLSVGHLRVRGDSLNFRSKQCTLTNREGKAAKKISDDPSKLHPQSYTAYDILREREVRCLGTVRVYRAQPLACAENLARATGECTLRALEGAHAPKCKVVTPKDACIAKADKTVDQTKDARWVVQLDDHETKSVLISP